MAFKQDRESGSKLDNSSTFNNFLGKREGDEANKRKAKKTKKIQKWNSLTPDQKSARVGGTIMGASTIPVAIAVDKGNMQAQSNNPNQPITFKDYIKTRAKQIGELFQ